MGLSLKIENMTTLPDGGPLAIDVPGNGGIDIGRDQHLDWTLPDPTRFISGKHCEIRFSDGAYWLHDVSTNGTFLNGAEEAHAVAASPAFGPTDSRSATTSSLRPSSSMP